MNTVHTVDLTEASYVKQWEEWAERREWSRQEKVAEMRTKLQSNDLEEFLSGFDPAEVGNRLHDQEKSGQADVKKLVQLCLEEDSYQRARADFSKIHGIDKFVSGLEATHFDPEIGVGPSSRLEITLSMMP